MWYGKQASPASSTSTVDQQEIILDDNNQPLSAATPIVTNNITSTNIYHLKSGTTTAILVTPTNNNQLITQTSSASSALATTTTTTTSHQATKRQTNSTTTKSTKRPRNTNSQYAKVNGTTGSNGGAATSKANQNHSNTSSGNNKCSPSKRPKLYSLPQQQLAPWKALQHHFLKHTDVKYRPEKRMTMAELGNEVLQRRNGWKVHHLVGQLTDLIQNELQNRKKISSLLDLFMINGAKRIHDLANNCHKLPEQYATLLQNQRSYGTNEFKPEIIVTKLDDLLRGDLQRSNMFDDHLRDCRDIIVRITDEHRDRVARITTKFNKRIQL